MLVLGTILFGIATLLLVIIVLVQCGSRDKDTSTLDNENLDSKENFRAIDENPVGGIDRKQATEFRLDVESDDKSPKLIPDKSDSSHEPKSTTDQKQVPRNSDVDCLSDKDNAEASAGNDSKIPKPLSQKSITPIDSKRQKESIKDAGSFENSGSGDGIYTKVKPVEKKEECAYSVVNISNKDSEYELVGGKLLRKQGEKKEKANESDYEHFEVGIKPQLDPVLFAVEDSGASGIYEDVPDSTAPVMQDATCRDDQGNSDTKPQEGHEEHKKKWGISRFSIIKRKGKQDRDSTKGDRQSLPSEPPTPEKLIPIGHGSSDQLNASPGKSEIVFPIVSARPKTKDDGLPPLPPIENRKLRGEHRRTYHEIQSEDREHLEKTRTLSGTELDTLATTIPDDEYDDMYEVPDRDVSQVKLKSDTKSLGRKLPHEHGAHGHGISPKLLHREVPKPPAAMELVVAVDDIDGDTSENYDTISCSLNLDEDFIQPLHSAPRAPHDTLEGGDAATEPAYAVVDRLGGRPDEEAKLPLSRVLSLPENITQKEEKKIEVLIRRTTISSNAKDRTKLREVSREIEVTETALPVTLQSAGPDEVNHSSVPSPADLEALYAKVDLEQKRLEAAKKSLYATVNKPKTGIIKVYSKSGSVKDQEEFEGGHYTKIKDDVQPNSTESQQKTAPPISSEYEEFGEDTLQTMFANLGSSKRAQLSGLASASKPIKRESTQGNRDYEDISEWDKSEAGSKVSMKKVAPDDYEEINVEKLSPTPAHNKDDYMDIGDIPGSDRKF